MFNIKTRPAQSQHFYFTRQLKSYLMKPYSSPAGRCHGGVEQPSTSWHTNFEKGEAKGSPASLSRWSSVATMSSVHVNETEVEHCRSHHNISHIVHRRSDSCWCRGSQLMRAHDIHSSTPASNKQGSSSLTCVFIHDVLTV